MIVRNTELDKFVIAEILPAGPMVKLNAKRTLDPPLNMPLERPIMKLKGLKVSVRFQKIKQNIK